MRKVSTGSIIAAAAAASIAIGGGTASAAPAPAPGISAEDIVVIGDGNGGVIEEVRGGHRGGGGHHGGWNGHRGHRNWNYGGYDLSFLDFGSF